MTLVFVYKVTKERSLKGKSMEIKNYIIGKLVPDLLRQKVIDIKGSKETEFINIDSVDVTELNEAFALTKPFSVDVTLSRYCERDVKHKFHLVVKVSECLYHRQDYKWSKIRRYFGKINKGKIQIRSSYFHPVSTVCMWQTKIFLERRRRKKISLKVLYCNKSSGAEVLRH